MTTPATATTKHWAPLDGIRGSALLFMLAYHLDRSEPKSGFFSIDMFFVLSGFLITSLLVGEREKSGLIHFGNFYARRALRLLPALFELLVLVLVLSLIFGNRVESHQTLTSIPYTLFYIANWHQVYGYLGSLGMLDHTWSLSLEEQFYFIWPITLVGLLTVFKNNRRLLAIGLMCASVGDMIYRYVLVWDNHSFPSGFLRVYYATDTHCDGLLMGCGMALLLASRTKPASDLARKLSKASACVGVVVLAVVMFAFNPFIVSSYANGIPIAVFSVAAIIWNLVTDPVRWIAAILGSKPFVFLGKRSYGFYLLHWPIYILITSYWGIHRNRCDLTELVLTFIAGTLSYKYIEEPFLRRKVKFQRTEALPKSFTAAD